MRKTLFALPFFLSLVVPTANAGAQSAIELRVFASDALEQPLRVLGHQFEKQHPGVDVHYEFSTAGVFAIGVVQGIPPDLFISAGEKYQEELTDSTDINFYSTLAKDHLLAAMPCDPPPCCDAPGVKGPATVSEANLIQSLMNPGTDVTIASPTLSPAGQATIAAFKAMDKKYPGAYEKIASHTRRVMDTGFVADAVGQRKTNVGIIYASQALRLQKDGACIRTLPVPMLSAQPVAFTVSVLNKSRFHFVDKQRKKLDEELEALYLSPAGQAVLKRYGFSVSGN